MQKLILSLAFVAASVVAFGCGGPKKPADLPELHPVKITVVQDGQPLEGATVTLAPNDASMRFVVGYKTDKSGVAEIRTQGEWKGAPAGTYKVLISKVDVKDTSELGPPPTDPDAKKEYDAKLAELSGQSADTVDPKYGKANTTPEEIEVAAGGVEKTIDVGAKVSVTFDESRPSSN